VLWKRKHKISRKAQFLIILIISKKGWFTQKNGL